MTTSPPVTLARTGRHLSWLHVAGVVAAVFAATQLRTLYWWATTRTDTTVLTVKTFAAVVAVGVIAATSTTVARRPAPGQRVHYTPLTTVTSCAVIYLAIDAANLAVGATATLFGQPIRSTAVPSGAPAHVWWMAFADDVLTTPIIEETLFRVVLLGALLTIVGPRTAILIQAILFGVAHTSLGQLATGHPITHVGGYNLTEAAATVVLGIGAGYITIEIGTVWPAVALHMFHNIGATFANITPISIATGVTLGAVAWYGIMRGLYGLHHHINLPTNPNRNSLKWRITRQTGPLVAATPKLQRPAAWVRRAPVLQR